MIRPQYHARRVNGRVHIWDVRKLLEQAEALPVEEVPLAQIREIDEPYWFDAPGDQPTCRALLAHMRQIEEVDLRFPILLCADGRVMDGMHRVMKALHDGRASIPARRLPVTPPPDHVDVPLSDLSY